MNIALLVVASTIGQCQTHGPVHTQPIYVQSCPAPSSVIREKICFSGEIRSRCIVEAVLSNGRKISVPVINGYMPDLKLTVYADGSELREYGYGDRDVYTGGVITYGNRSAVVRQPAPVRRPTVTEERTPVLPSPVPYDERQPEVRTPPRMPRYTDEDFETLQKDLKELQQTIRVLQEREESAERPPLTLQADPQRIEPQPPKLKKPSEFGQTK